MKIKVGVIFGGESVEHEVSIISAIQAINKIDCDITLRVLSNKGFRADSYNVKVYPTTIFYKAKSAKGTIFEGNFEEIARLEGSFPIDYLNKVIDKLKLEV